MTLRPITLSDANSFVRKYHRHRGAVLGSKFALAAWDGFALVGVCIVGRPVSRVLDDGLTCEITRLCTDGTRNAASFLLGRARRAAFAQGYRKVVTYTLESEDGASLRAAGFEQAQLTGGRSWNTPSRPRAVKNTEKKWRWESESKS